MKKMLLLAILISSVSIVYAQYEDSEKKGFKKENLFSGGSISLSFFNNSFLVGANPVFGYRLANWVDGGIVANFQWTSYRDYAVFDDRLRQSIYGGGLFARLFPINFLFVQGQIEHNFLTQKYIPAPNSGDIEQKAKTSANSVLVGGGYATGRSKDGNSPFFYLTLLFDVSGNSNSPYMDSYGRTIPIIRAGFNIPLFQGQGGGGF